MDFIYLNIKLILVFSLLFSGQNTKNQEKSDCENSCCFEFPFAVFEKKNENTIIRTDNFELIALGDFKLKSPEYVIDYCFCNESILTFKIIVLFPDSIKGVHLYHAKSSNKFQKESKFRIFKKESFPVVYEMLPSLEYFYLDYFPVLYKVHFMQISWIKIPKKSNDFLFMSIAYDDEEELRLIDLDSCK